MSWCPSNSPACPPNDGAGPAGMDVPCNDDELALAVFPPCITSGRTTLRLPVGMPCVFADVLCMNGLLDEPTVSGDDWRRFRSTGGGDILSAGDPSRLGMFRRTGDCRPGDCRVGGIGARRLGDGGTEKEDERERTVFACGLVPTTSA